MTCKLITYEEALHHKWIDSIWNEGRRRMAEARRTRTCVWCAEPVASHRDYPACEDCREYRQVEAP